MATSGSSSASSSSSSPMTSSVSVNEVVSGSHLFKITGYSLTKGIGVGEPIASAVFTVGGYDWAIEYYPDGCKADDADYISFFLALQSYHTDVQIYWAIKLLDPAEMPPSAVPVGGSLYTFDSSGRNWGYGRFFKRAELEESRYLKDDCFAVMCTIHIKMSRVERVPYAHPSAAAAAPPIELHDHLGRLLERGEGADVTFEVGGETFAAHRCVLAARSPVFSAQFFGPLSEKSTQCVKIEDMEAAAFRALLHFIYRDSLPEDGEEPKKASTAMAQHLLAAADRYGLERLKLICEDRLCNSIDADTAATSLALAEQHGCLRLKKVCLEFAVVPENLISMVLTEGFEHLRMSCPSVLEDLRMKTTRHSGNHDNIK
ncbi:BTB/POZ and MATH domain-containing protein 1-like isoform X3 [Ananas comosus]|uniref:BTB/POZ and MATH domain-containing protein 1-like isoform X3 n=1 Tax=Ananas comosus TaxID=4615 RepID=A0A6P5EIV2_ANACO|nr:BTB/POZ and MATH domain-containing protein 1-like isoform X3 [Ananas comosus]